MLQTSAGFARTHQLWHSDPFARNSSEKPDAVSPKTAAANISKGGLAILAAVLGAERVMFGTDHLTNIPVELAKLEGIKLSAGQREAYLRSTAMSVFSLPNPVDAVDN